MSNLSQGFASPAAFKQALILAFGSMVSPRQAPAALFAPSDAPTEVAPTSPSCNSSALPPVHWDPALLHQVEIVLAKHVGPIAAVLVRRSAPACHDLPTLYERLAEQVANPGGGSVGDTPASSAPTGTSLGLIPDSLITASAKVLAGYLGPIAPVVARRAAATAPDRAAFFGTLEAVIADPEERNAVHTLLGKLH